MSPCPTSTAACTYSRALTDSTSPRTTRAMGGQLTTAMATMRLVAEGVRMATSTMAKMNDGMVWKNSVRRISPSSTKPPK